MRRMLLAAWVLIVLILASAVLSYPANRWSLETGTAILASVPQGLSQLGGLEPATVGSVVILAGLLGPLLFVPSLARTRKTRTRPWPPEQSRRPKNFENWMRIVELAEQGPERLGHLVVISQRARTGTKGYMEWYPDWNRTAVWFRGLRPQKGSFHLVTGSFGYGSHHGEETFFVDSVTATLPKGQYPKSWRPPKVRIPPQSIVGGSRYELILGQGLGGELLSFIANAKRRLVVVSPYLRSEVAEVLRQKALSGVEVTLLTSEDAEKQFDVRRCLVRQRRTTRERAQKLRTRGLRWTGWSLVGLLAAGFALALFALSGQAGFLPSAAWPTLGVFLLAGVVLRGVFRKLRIYDYNYSWILTRVRIFFSPYYGERAWLANDRLFIHSKIVIADGQSALVGSANLTHKGLADNHETMVRVEQPDVIAQLEAHLLGLYDDPRWRSRSVTELGRAVYGEAPN